MASTTRTRLPVLDVARVRYLAERLSVANSSRSCSIQVWPRLRGRTITLEEMRSSWDGTPLDDDARWLIAQLRYEPQSEEWTLYFPGRSRWERVRACKPARFLEPLIREIERHPRATPWFT
ncbi:MAG: DUF3024 domain-containing protein [Actinomycetota bacterium]